MIAYHEWNILFLPQILNSIQLIYPCALEFLMMFNFLFHSGLALLVLICLSFAYTSTESQSESIAAEKLVGFHKKLQQVNDFEPVKFLPVR